ncbi:outer membrane protein assembly factor BamB [Lysobacter oculi]|uniref:Outer membrane protein assembly factor BamB n=1 Tax=Solilutibacter oculi TaxID=2698682 RepID=A0A344J4R2_9GAMM|nr:outer membrane protein assembly factor BamB [Lysobacter oculi]AXA84022.1 outer membrane protein assembly factor BamB [Lysobacter oculi]
MTSNRSAIRVLGLVACVAVLGGCTTLKGWFGGKKGAETKPAALVEFTPDARIDRVWTANLGGGDGRIGVGQRPVVSEGRVYAAGGGNTVRALDLQSGQAVWTWSGDKGGRFAGGPGVGQGIVAVGGLDGDVVALDASTGAEKWKANLLNEVIAAPAIGGGMVFVRSNDGRVTAFDANNGEKRWSWRADMPALTVRGNAGLTLGPGYLFVGNDNGKIVALSAADGSELWDMTVAQPEGRSELDRMNDVDGAPLLEGSTLYVSSYKPQTMAIDAPTGRPLWVQQGQGGVGGIGFNGSRLAVTDAHDVVWALDATSGAPMWKQPSYPRRALTAPAIIGNHVVAGDYDGYLHWFSLDDGHMSARVRVSRKPLRAQPVVADGLLLAQDTDGNLSAYRVGQ